MIFKTT